MNVLDFKMIGSVFLHLCNTVIQINSGLGLRKTETKHHTPTQCDSIKVVLYDMCFIRLLL